MKCLICLIVVSGDGMANIIGVYRVWRFEEVDQKVQNPFNDTLHQLLSPSETEGATPKGLSGAMATTLNLAPIGSFPLEREDIKGSR